MKYYGFVFKTTFGQNPTCKLPKEEDKSNKETGSLIKI